MTKAGKSMIRGALQALAFARGEGDPKAYRVHTPEEIAARRAERAGNDKVKPTGDKKKPEA